MRISFAAAIVSVGMPFAGAQTPIPLPKVTALSATRDSLPFLAAERNLRPYNLTKLGYSEREFLISGAKPSLVTDEYGAGVGGVRSFYVEIPAASYSPGSPGPGLCATQGHTFPFDWGTLEGLYGSYKNYTGKVIAAVDSAVQDRWLTETDAGKIKAGLAVRAPG